MITIQEKPSLARRTTLGIGGTALAEVQVTDALDCFALDSIVKKIGGTPFILGAGSNILADDGELPFVLIHPNIRTEPIISYEVEGKALVTVGAGFPLQKLLYFCAENGLSGLEGLVGIPGNVGGAVAMNAGSYGVETCAQLHSIVLYHPEHGIWQVDAAAIQYGYRYFCPCENLKNYMVLQATFALTQKESNGIKKSMSLNFLKKKSTQPVAARSAGCVFKNPLGESAGRLLDAAGLKGKQMCGMAFSSVHANFLVNEGGGSAQAAFALIDCAREAVLQQFGIQLEMEVRVISWQSR
ncbi:MAG: UDP-N-acetylmuramate dehydrogenase [Desulfovibrionaceae bacterium]|nr:UDP-N-acetylmuramate dehydrogenase [Desulfovibrionaceae bacterium]